MGSEPAPLDVLLLLRLLLGDVAYPTAGTQLNI